MKRHSVRRWPLILIASPAAVAIWSGWVALGQMCGFGIVSPLPGIWEGLKINTAITLPIGVEAYGAYALGAWLAPETPRGARGFARWSSIGALGLGMGGQVIYHLLAAAHATRAPWPVVVVVSCLPVVTLGFGAALTHLLGVPVDDETTPVPLPGSEPEDHVAPEFEPASDPIPSTSVEAAKASMRVTVAAGNPWSVNQLVERFSLTRATATKVRREVLAELADDEADEDEAA